MAATADFKELWPESGNKPLRVGALHKLQNISIRFTLYIFAQISQGQAENYQI